MKVVAALFDSDTDATNAMDRLLRSNFKDLDTRVFEAGQNTNAESPGVFVPFVPNTGGAGAGLAGGPVNVGIAGLGAAGGWMDELDDEVERAFYLEGFREGSTLAMARVNDEDAPRVRQMLRSFGARTYTEQ
jgi:hypothetical protein